MQGFREDCGTMMSMGAWIAVRNTDGKLLSYSSASRSWEKIILLHWIADKYGARVSNDNSNIGKLPSYGHRCRRHRPHSLNHQRLTNPKKERWGKERDKRGPILSSRSSL